MNTRSTFKFSTKNTWTYWNKGKTVTVCILSNKNPHLFTLQTTHTQCQASHCKKHMWKMVAAESYVTSFSATFPWINNDLLICTSDPWWKQPQRLIFTHWIHQYIIICWEQTRWMNEEVIYDAMFVGPSPRHGASSGCGWRNGLRYGG